MNPVLLTLIKSISITILVAITVSYFLASFSIPFLNTFVFCIIIQFLFFYFYGEYVKNKKNKFLLAMELKEIEERNKQSTTVTCPCDRNIKTTIPIDVNSVNDYVCPGCNKNISVFVTTRTALATTPMSVNPLESPVFLESIEEKLKTNAN